MARTTRKRKTTSKRRRRQWGGKLDILVEQDWDRVPHPRISVRGAWDQIGQTISKEGILG